MTKKEKKPKSSDSKLKPKHSLDGHRPNNAGGKGQRTAATVRRLNMYKTRAKRDKNGKVLWEDLQSKDLPSTRIQPDRRWFGNTRVIGQKQLDQFREEMSSKVNDAYTVLLREKKLPMQLLQDPDKKAGAKEQRANLLATAPFKTTFGKNLKRKRPSMNVTDYDALMQQAEDREGRFSKASTSNPSDGVDLPDAVRESVFGKGTSKRIWGELYKVLDSSDVIVMVLDARDPEGTRVKYLEQHIRKNTRHKHLLLLLNKCDLVPSWVTKRWLHHLSREFPTLAFHSSLTHPFGKGALLGLLRQLARLRSDKQAISVGFIGYPNVGKSSVINTLKTKKVCKAAPVPGETKIWQYITLMKRIFCIDCPGVVYNKVTDTESELVLKGVVRVENLEDATPHVAEVIRRVKPEYLTRAYQIRSWTDHEDFLAQLAHKAGKLLRGGEPDLNTAARMVLYDFQRGKIPYYTLPPGYKDEKPGKEEVAEVPLPAQAVTEEDAAAEAGARPDTAAAAARAVQEAIAKAVALQTRAALPLAQDLYGEEAQEGEEALGGEDPDAISEGSEDEDESDAAAGEDAEDPEEEGPSGSGWDAEEGEEEEELPGTRPAKAKGAAAVVAKSGRGASKAAGRADSEAEDEGAGYGQGGLSWEAVMRIVQGGGEESDSESEDEAVEAGGIGQAEEAEQHEAEPAPAKRRRGRKGAAIAAGQQAPAPVAGRKRKGAAGASRNLKTLE